MLSPLEALTQKLSTAGFFFGSLASVVFSEIGSFVAANGAFAIAAIGLAVNWYYQRRRDRRDQIRFEQEQK